MAQNLKTNDNVKIISGANKGKTGKIVKIDRENGKAMIEGIGIRERHIRANQFNPKGSKKTIHLGIDLSNLKLEKSTEKAAKSTKKTTKKGAK